MRHEDGAGREGANKCRVVAGHEEEARRLTRQPVFRRSCILGFLRTWVRGLVRLAGAPWAVVDAGGGAGAGVVHDDGEEGKAGGEADCRVGFYSRRCDWAPPGQEHTTGVCDWRL